MFPPYIYISLLLELKNVFPLLRHEFTDPSRPCFIHRVHAYSLHNSLLSEISLVFVLLAISIKNSCYDIILQSNTVY